MQSPAPRLFDGTARFGSGVQSGGQFFDAIHRAVTSARAADRDCCVFLALLHEPRQEHLDQFGHSVEEGREIRVSRNEATDLGIKPGSWTQNWVVMGVPQEAR